MKSPHLVITKNATLLDLSNYFDTNKIAEAQNNLIMLLVIFTGIAFPFVLWTLLWCYRLVKYYFIRFNRRAAMLPY